jgi:predicted O-methyltransferase YrrM
VDRVSFLPRAFGHLVVLVVSVAWLQLASLEAAAAEGEFSQDWTSDHARSWVSQLAEFKGKPGVRMLEVGTFEGRSAIWFVQNVLTHPSASITCVDPFNWPTPESGVEERFDHNVEQAGVADKITKIKGSSHHVLRELDLESFDIIYVDGCHSAACVYVDAALSWLLLKPQGVMILDDYGLGLESVQKPPRPITHRPKLAIDAFVESFLPSIRVTELGDQLVIRKLNSGFPP